MRTQLTARGRGLLVAAAALLVGARLFGSAELAGLAAAAGLAVAAGAVSVHRAPMTVRAGRRLTPARVGVGDPARARLRFTNTGRAPTRPAEALDAVDDAAVNTAAAAGSGGAGCVVPPLAPGAVAEAGYDLATVRRGTLVVGPLTLSVPDPFGLVERRVEAAGTSRLVVHPRILPVLALPGSPTREARHGGTTPARSPRGDDFFTLREYEVGDDLRRVHWRSTARHGELMLRQDELRFGEVATVLLDTRPGAHSAGSFERALEVGASIAAALVDDGRRLRFVTTAGFEAELDGAARAHGGGARAEARWAAVLEHLALVTFDPTVDGPDGFALTVQSIRRAPSGPLAAVVGHATPAELAALGSLRTRLGLVLIAVCAEESAPAGDGTAVAAPGATLVRAAPAEDFAARWNAAVLACGRREAVRR